MSVVGPTNEAGHALGHASPMRGTPFDASEFTMQLAWPLNVNVYDRMRRQDAQCKSILDAVTLPIRRGRWTLHPEGAPDDVVRQIADEMGLPVNGEDRNAARRRLRDRGRLHWQDHVRLACMSAAYGHMPFEIVGEVGDDGRWHLQRLGERLPPTIANINVSRNGDVTSIEQYPSGRVGDVGPFIELPGDRLVFYSHEREGGMWQGQSIYRSAYKHWLLKDRLIRVDAMRHDRNGLGVPTFEAPENASDHLLSQLQQIASVFRAGESSGMAAPAGAKFRLVGVEGSLPDTLASIRYHDEQIAQQSLAMFMQLGKTETGSRALGNTFVDFFLMALQAFADELEQTINTQLVERWVDWNWGEDVPAPRVRCDDVSQETDLTADAIGMLVQSGALVADDGVDTYLRERFKLPPRSGDVREPPTPGVRAGRSRRPFLAAMPGNTAQAPSDWSGADFLAELTAHWSDVIDTALRESIDYDALDLARSVLADGVAPAQAVLDGVDIDTAMLVSVLQDAWTDAWLVGYHVGEEELDALGVEPTTVTWAAAKPKPATPFDWGEWTPGNPDAARVAAASKDGGLAALLETAEVEIQGITGTTLDSLGNTLASGLERGVTIADLAADINVIVDDPARAMRIAQTEMSRAVHVASIEAYEANGVEGLEWELSDGACELCEENADAGVIAVDEAFPNGDPPVHPWCVCTILPVVVR